MNLEQRNEHIKRIDAGKKAKGFLESDGWVVFMKPMLDSMVRGLTDIRSLKSAEIDSEKKATVEVKARKLAAEYIETIEELIKGYIIDGIESEKLVEKELKVNTLYKKL